MLPRCWMKCSSPHWCQSRFALRPGSLSASTPGCLLLSTTYLPINRGIIDYIYVWITDQNNNPVNFRGDDITIRFHLRKITLN